LANGASRYHLAKLYWLNLAANLGGFIVIIALSLCTPLAFFKFRKAIIAAEGWLPTLLFIVILEILVSLLGITLQFVIQRPIVSSFRYRKSQAEFTPEIFEKARRRLLNLPFILASVNLSMWTALSFIGSVLQYLVGNEMLITCLYLFFRGVMIGMIASTASFFLIERHSRNHLIPALFPEGDLISVTGTIKISMSRRLKALYMAGTTIPMKILVVTLLFVFWEVEAAAVSAAEFSREILIFTVVLYGIFIPIALRLNVWVGSSIARPTQEMMRLVKRVRNGDFKRKVRVVSNDELGVLGEGLNQMSRGLRERDRMRQSLNLAMEIQQNLLPQNNPAIQGLDIAGKSIYCDETGGDYFDYFSENDNSKERISLVIGDVSGHGIPSALLMATGRAFLRQRVALSGRISSIVTDVNRQLARDIEASGRFMTLFFLTIEIQKRRLIWVRAGHDPAVLYDPAGDAFEELRGPGIALGVNPMWHYEENEKSELAADQILLLGTDGLWEAQNLDGRMFGKESVYEIIRQNATDSAVNILDALLAGWKGFIEGRDPEDDVTLIVVKIG
jgi:sigma-B regulation protein RsbU (phosphoserine phosphatase)